MEKVSVIVPVYNAEQYIDRALESICRQTYKELEILLIDDGSTDRSLTHCEAWALKDKRVRIYSQKNAGVSAARNKGLELATGSFIMFVDADDWIERNMIEVLVRELHKNQADASCCMLQETEETKGIKEANMAAVWSTQAADFAGKIKIGAGQAESGLLLLKVWAVYCKLYRREIVENIRFENYKVAEDLLFNTNVICSGQIKKAVFVDYPFYHYMIYQGSAMKQQFQEKYLVAMEVEKRCYDMLTAVSEEFADINLIGCSVSRVFEKYAQLSKMDRKKHKKEFAYCKKFAKEHKKKLLYSADRHRRISGALKVYIPNLYLQMLIRRYQK